MHLVKVPATSANLGPGFDCLGVALGIYNTIGMEETGEGLRVDVSGKGSDRIERGPGNLVYRAAERVFREAGYRPDGLHLVLHNDIPLSRGMGSSAAAIIGGMVCANELAGGPLTRERILTLATEMEGHSDNVTPALYGAFTISYRERDGSIGHFRFEAPRELYIALAVPDVELSTSEARAVLPKTVSMADAVFNLGRASLLVASLMTGSYDRLRAACEDRLHQPYRAVLIPGLDEVIGAAMEAGAYAAMLSGAGPTTIAFCGEGALDGVLKAMGEAYRRRGTPCSTRQCRVAVEGTLVSDRE